MATGSIKKANTLEGVTIQGTLKQSVNISGGGGRATIFSHTSLENAFSALDIGYIPNGKKLKGAVFLWANGSNYVPIDCIGWDDGTLTLSVYNLANTAGTISAVRLITFWE